MNTPAAGGDTRAEPFAFACSRCSNCCYDKRIQLNPYEVARLAANRGISAEQFRASSTQEGLGLHLAHREDGSCVFLGPQGCDVHADRPLVCRLYPLGRHVWEDGTERFSHMTPHPKSRGTFSKDGTIGGYIAAQGVDPFIAAADAYLGWFARARAKLALDGMPESQETATRDTLTLFDLDAAIAEHCAATGKTAPQDIDERLKLHIAILDDWLSQTGDEA